MPIKLPTVQTGFEQSIDKAAKRAGKNLKINMGPGAKSIEGLTRPLGRLTGKADEFTKSMEAANARVLAFGASVGVIAAVSTALKQLVTTSIEVEKSLANINSILNQSASQLDGFKNQIFDIARNTGQTFDTVAEAALELSRQGLKAEEVTKRLNDALVLSRLSGLSAAESVAGLTAAVNSFSSAGLTTSDVLNKISAAAASAAVSDRDLIEGLKRSGAVAVASGVKFDELIGIISALQERTARGGSVIGNSLKTIFTRIQDIEKLNTLQDLGVQVTDLGGQVLSSSQIIENLAPVFAKLDQASKVNLADNLVGKFQIAPFLALLEDFNQKISRSGEVATTSFNATNEAYKRNEVLSQTLATAINTTTVSLKELANALGEIGVTDNLSKIIGVFNSVVSSITGILDGEGIGSKFAKGLIKGIGAIIAGPGLALALLAIGKLLLDFAKFGTGALKTFFGLNKAAEAQKILQGQIAASLLNDKGIRSAILSIEQQNISAAEKKVLQTKFFTKALNEQLMVMQKMQGIAMNIAPGVMRGTASRRGGRAAGGFLPIGAEKSDISRGVGGAPASAKPVVIPNFAFGGGKRGTMVANSSEYIVPNYANGGDAIFNQNMASSMGLPANARKVRAASGYIPNFARTLLQGFRAGFGDKLNRKHTRADFFKGDKPRTDEIRNVMEKHPNSPEGKKLLALKNRDKDKGKRSFMANQEPNKSIMLVPRRERFLLNGSDHKFLSPFESVKNGKIDFFEGPSSGISKRLKKDTVLGGRFKTLLTLDGDIEKALARGVNGIFTKFRKKAGPKAFKVEPNKITSDNIKTIMEKGGPGALGAIKGATFEALMRAIVGGVSQDAKEGELDIDFSKDEGNILDVIFGIQGKNFKFGDFKSSRSGGNKTKFAKQILNNVAGKVAISRKAKTTNSKSAASGYIPNFAEGALENAIGREKAAGLPVSQIRINQSGKLRNSQNPMGLAVTNTRDEPTGAIPNFVGGVPSMGGLMDKKFEKAADSAEKSAKALDKNTNNLNKNAKSSEGLTGKLIAVQMGMSLFNSGLGEATKETEGFKGNIAALGQGVIAATQTFFMMQAMGMSPGFRLAGSRRSMATTALAVRSKVTMGAKGGMLNKATKGLGGFIGKLAGGFGRLVPIIGTAITAFMLLNPIIKKLTGDSILGHIGKALGLIDTPAEKASKALGKLADEATRNLKSGADPFKDAAAEIRKEIAKQQGIGVTDEDTAGSVLVKRAVAMPSENFANLRTTQTVNENDAGPMTGRQFRRDRLVNIRFSKKTRKVGEDVFLRGSDTNFKVSGIPDSKIIEESDKVRTQFMVSMIGTFTDEEIAKLVKTGDPKAFAKKAQKVFKSFDISLQNKILDNLTDLVGLDLTATERNKGETEKLKVDKNTQISQLIAAGVKPKKDREADLEKQKQDDLINVANAKARLKATIELRKFQLLNITDKKNELEVAQTLGTLTQKELRDEQLKVQLQDMRVKTANERLSTVSKEIDKIEGIKGNLKAVEAIEGAISKASAATVNNTDDFKKLIADTLVGLGKERTEAENIADRLLAGSESADELKESALETADRLGTAKNNALDLVGALQQAADAASRVKILDEGGVQLAAAKKQNEFRVKEIDLQNRLNEAQNENNQPLIDSLNKQLKQLDIDRFSDPAIKALRNQGRENAALSAGNQILSVSGVENKAVKQALGLVAEGKVDLDLGNRATTAKRIETALGESLKASGMSKEDIEKNLLKANTAELIKHFDLVKQIDQARKTSLETSKKEQLMQEKSLQQSRDQLDIDTRSVEIRLKRLNNGIQESREAAMAQKAFEAQQFKKMGLGEKSALSQEDFKTIQNNEDLTPASALEKARLESSFEDRMKKKLVKDDAVINSDFLDKMVDSSVQFRDNFVSAFAEGIKSVDDLEDALLNAADQFLKAMTKNFIDKFMNQAASEGLGGGGSKGGGSGGGGFMGFVKGIGSLFGFADGGKVRGGSGSRDDVPAMLMGGEFVMNKKAVQRYGSGFMEAINSGSVRGFARGGQVRDEEGMFTTPGMNGAGAIVGMRDLMSFATQTPVAMNRDTLTNNGAFLDAESGRMTMFGRRNNPQFQKVQDAKKQAFSLALQEAEAHRQAKEQEVKLGDMLAAAVISSVVSFGATKLGMKAGLSEGMSGLIGSGLGNFAGTKITGAPASGGAFGAAGATGDLMNIFSGDEDKGGNSESYFDVGGAGSGTGLPSDGPMGSMLPGHNTMPRRATGGLIPAAGGVDTVPAMLSGGEFVMNAAATRNIGAGNLQALNSGAGTGDNTDLVAKLDELITATETSQSTGDINITINGPNGAENQTAEDATETQKQLSEKIKVAVKQVIADEQRLGGQLRR
tara:strand:- start:70420 stop:77484 length:7065 start_codon:yes stop_codon:yes gene_type:complete